MHIGMTERIKGTETGLGRSTTRTGPSLALCKHPAYNPSR